MPETMQGMKRTDYCGQLRAKDIGREVVLMGWVQRRRDHGGLIFVDLRDRSGLVQIVFTPDSGRTVFTRAEAVRSEFVLALRGKVAARPEGTINPNLPTGELEVYATELRILNESKTPPFAIAENVDVDETVRLKYRYLDLRRPNMQANLVLRHKATQAVRRFLDSRGFLEIETPMLTRSTPEGARDYLVPSRVHPGEFFALPQSPQLFKQLLMVSGMERYFQIVRCFRDEDLRADRQPEFTQIDIEMSFVETEDVLTLAEEMMAHVFHSALGREISLPLPRLTWDEAMARYGSDKPDTRFGMELQDVSDIVAGSQFKVFSETVKKGGQVKGLNATGCAGMPRREIDDLTGFVGDFGAKGLAWIAFAEDGVKSPIAKFLTDAEMEQLKSRLGARQGDLLFFVADNPAVVADALGHLRLELGARLGLIDQNKLNFVWVTDFPLFDYSEEEKRWVAEHHPFTSPRDEDIDRMQSDPGAARAKAYDLVLNGIELGGGSIRIHRRDVQ
ncbi:MAG: aspartate--tRNA ligase, partial [Syntrophothermus sp.]